jgi:hypothetical protein
MDIGKILSYDEAKIRFRIYVEDIISILRECSLSTTTSTGIYKEFKPKISQSSKASVEMKDLRKKLSKKKLKEVLKQRSLEITSRKRRFNRVVWKGGIATEVAVQYNNLNRTEYNSLLLKPNDLSSFYYGVHPRRVSDRKIRIEPVNQWSKMFYDHNKSLCEAYGVNPNTVNVVNPCVRTSLPTLQRFMDNQPLDAQPIPEVDDVMAYFDECYELYNEIGGRGCAVPTRREQLNSKFNLESGPGFRYSEILGLNNKKESAVYAWQAHTVQMRRIQRSASKGETINLSHIIRGFWSIGGRRSLEDTNEDTDVKSRPIHVPEMHSQFIAGGIEQAISGIINEHGKGPLFKGNSIVDPSRRYEYEAFSDFKVETDCEKFDSSTKARPMVACIALSGMFFEPTLTMRSQIKYHAVNTMDRYYVLPYGQVYRMTQGHPSGDKMTYIQGSFYNYICTKKALKASGYDSKDVRLAIGIDDLEIFLRGDASTFDIVKYKENSLKFGLKIKDGSYVKDAGQNSIENKTAFYKYVLKGTEPTVRCRDMLKRLMLPQDTRIDSIQKAYSHVKENISNMGLITSHLLPVVLYASFITYLYDKRVFSGSFGSTIIFGRGYISRTLEFIFNTSVGIRPVSDWRSKKVKPSVGIGSIVHARGKVLSGVPFNTSYATVDSYIDGFFKDRGDQLFSKVLMDYRRSIGGDLPRSEKKHSSDEKLSIICLCTNKQVHKCVKNVFYSSKPYFLKKKRVMRESGLVATFVDDPPPS